VKVLITGTPKRRRTLTPSLRLINTRLTLKLTSRGGTMNTVVLEVRSLKDTLPDAEQAHAPDRQQPASPPVRRPVMGSVMPHEFTCWTIILLGRIVVLYSRLLKLPCSRSNGRSTGARKSEASSRHTSPSFPVPEMWCPILAVFEKSAGGGLVLESPEVFASSTSRVQPRKKSYFYLSMRKPRPTTSLALS